MIERDKCKDIEIYHCHKCGEELNPLEILPDGFFDIIYIKANCKNCSIDYEIVEDKEGLYISESKDNHKESEMNGKDNQQKRRTRKDRN